ncbi:hypothetical protein Dalu01_02394 [Deinococcus aluminii]|uniref:Uncharacterized protein n=1 Tax=Deinococcus aluminii TaxID=1656885 RepID=A0ABP9XF41_9DEIO
MKIKSLALASIAVTYLLASCSGQLDQAPPASVAEEKVFNFAPF